MTLQRLRITYRKTAEASALSSGGLNHAWVEAFDCAGMPLARPEGSKRRRIEAGPPLPHGATGERELVDVVLEPPVPPQDVLERLERTLPAGLCPEAVEEVGERLPSIQASMRAARYRITFDAGAVDAAALEARALALLALTSLPIEELRGERLRQLDLRPLVYALAVSAEDGCTVLEARLALSHEQSARPATLLAALGIEAAMASFVRTDIEVVTPRVALRAWRERGRFQ